MRSFRFHANGLLIAVLALALFPTVTAQAGDGRRGHAASPGTHPRVAEPVPEAARPGPAGPRDVRTPLPVDDRSGVDDAVEQRRRVDRRCARAAVDCDDDYVYDDDDASEAAPAAAMPTHAAEPEASSAKSQSPAKLSESAAPNDAVVESFTPTLGSGLRAEMQAARKNWLAKKSALDEANTAWARAEYQAYETGEPADPWVARRQEQAQAEADEAWNAMAPLVKRARDAGISESLIELYEDVDAAH